MENEKKPWFLTDSQIHKMIGHWKVQAPETIGLCTVKLIRGHCYTPSNMEQLPRGQPSSTTEVMTHPVAIRTRLTNSGGETTEEQIRVPTYSAMCKELNTALIPYVTEASDPKAVWLLINRVISFETGHGDLEPFNPDHSKAEYDAWWAKSMSQDKSVIFGVMSLDAGIAIATNQGVFEGERIQTKARAFEARAFELIGLHPPDGEC